METRPHCASLTCALPTLPPDLSRASDALLSEVCRPAYGAHPSSHCVANVIISADVNENLSRLPWPPIPGLPSALEPKRGRQLGASLCTPEEEMEVGFGRLNAGCSRVLYMLYLHTPRDRDQSGWRRRAAVKTLATEDGTFDIGRARATR